MFKWIKEKAMEIVKNNKKKAATMGIMCIVSVYVFFFAPEYIGQVKAMWSIANTFLGSIDVSSIFGSIGSMFGGEVVPAK